VTEANAEARKVLRDAITEKEHLMGDVRRIQALLRSALSVVDETPADTTDTTEAADAGSAADAPDAAASDSPGWTAQPRVAPSLPVALPSPREESEGIRKLAG